MSKPEAARLPLNLDQLLGRDVIAVVSAVGAGVSGADNLAHMIAVGRCDAQHGSAALVRISLFAVRAQGLVIGMAQFQHPGHPSCQKRSLRYLSAESDRTVTITASRPALRFLFGDLE